MKEKVDLVIMGSLVSDTIISPVEENIEGCPPHQFYEQVNLIFMR